jgi:hypothetical protein
MPDVLVDDPLDAPDDAGRPRRRWTIGKVLAIVCVLGLTVMWVYALSGVAGRDVAGRLDDRTFGPTAEPTCKAARADVDALPPAFETPDPTQRADVVDQATARLRTMVRDLDALPRPAGDDATMVTQWLADWTTYLDNRADYASRLRVDRTARFYVAQREADKRQITEALDRFAGINDMPSCETPGDVG